MKAASSLVPQGTVLAANEDPLSPRCIPLTRVLDATRRSWVYQKGVIVWSLSIPGSLLRFGVIRTMELTPLVVQRSKSVHLLKMANVL